MEDKIKEELKKAETEETEALTMMNTLKGQYSEFMEKYNFSLEIAKAKLAGARRIKETLKSLLEDKQ